MMESLNPYTTFLGRFNSLSASSSGPVDGPGPADVIRVDEGSIEALVDSLLGTSMDSALAALHDIDQRVSPIATPLAFQNVAQEVNFRATVHALSIGSQHQSMAHLAHQSSLADVVLFGVIGAHITNSALDAKFLRNMTSSDTSHLFSLPRHEEIPSEHAWMKIEKPGGMISYSDLLSDVMSFYGREMQRGGARDWHDMLSRLVEGAASVPHACSIIAAKLDRFDDRYLDLGSSDASTQCSPVELCFFKNLRRLLHDLHCIATSAAAAAQAPEATEAVKARSRSLTPFLFGARGGLAAVLAAPSSNGIQNLQRMHVLRILTKPSDSTTSESTTPSEVVKDAAFEAAVRCAAIIACHQISELLIEKLVKLGLDAAQYSMNPIRVSILLDNYSVGSPEEFNEADLFVPKVTGNKW
jgi:hypothetical protein